MINRPADASPVAPSLMPECAVIPRVQPADLPLYQAGQVPNAPRRGRWVAGETDRRVLKLSSNERTAPPPPFIRRALRRAARGVHRYPPRHSTAVSRQLAERFGVDETCVTLGNGSDELMSLIGQAYFNTGDEVLIPRHTFSIYAHVARVAGATAVIAEMPNEAVSIEALRTRLSPRTKAIFLATPNNPTGGYLTTEQIGDLCQNTPAHILIVVDHAYADFCVAPDFCTAESLILRYPNLMTLRTFSKLDGLAGLRIGYAISHPRIALQLNRIRMPFNINSSALHAAVAALAHRHYALRLRDRIVYERDVMRGRLIALGYEVLEAHGNFLPLRLDHDSEELAGFFSARGVTVRPLHSFGLPQHLRITIAASRRVNARAFGILAEYARLHGLSRTSGNTATTASMKGRRGRQ